MASVTLSRVAKSYGSVQVMKGIDLGIQDGEFVILVGPSGCGKSSLLRMIAGLEAISDGTVTIGPDVVNDRAPKDCNIAMVFQSYALYPHKTVSENMGFSLTLARRPEAEIAAKVRAAAQILNLGPLMDRYPKALSGGQRQRVAMGRAIVRDPSVFLFDEPLSNLDAKLRVQMRTEIKALHQRLKGEARDGQFTTQGGARFACPGLKDGPALAGIRPEHIVLGGPVPARVIVDEPTGAETLIARSLGSETIHASFRARLHPAPGEALALDFPPEHLHFFDTQTGERL